MKVYVFMGKVYMGLNKYEEVRKVYKKVFECEFSKQSFINDYLVEVDRVERFY